MLAHTNVIFLLGIITPLVLVCLIFVVVGIAGGKTDTPQPGPGATGASEPLTPFDSRS